MIQELIEGRCEEESGFVPFVATTMKRAQDALHRWLSFLSFSFFFTVKGGRQHSLNVFRAASQCAGSVQHTSAVWKQKKKKKLHKLKLCTTK